MPGTESLLRDRMEQGVLAVDVVDDVDRFGELRAEWTDLLRQSSSNNPFLTWDWLYAWWTHLAASRTLQILTVREGNDRLVAVAPLCVARGRLPWLSQLEFLGTGWAGSDYLDLIARRGYEDASMAAFAGWFRSCAKSARLDHLRPSALAATLSERLTDAGWSRESSPSGICPFATLRAHSWESYLDTLRPSQRTRCRRYLHTLQKRFDVSFERVETESQRRAALSALMGFHAQRWTPRGGSTAFQTADLRAFHHEVTSRALDSGWLRLFSLRLSGDVAAVTYCFHLNGRFYLYQHGFDPQFWPYSVGVVVLGLTIRSAIDEGASEFDLLYGDEPYKALWANEMRQLERIELFPPHLGGRLYRRTVDAERSMRTLARRIFSRKPCDSNVPPAGAVS
jgi:CelD/BcsL family acetyltransferase involved in cellulose biosynthesis